LLELLQGLLAIGLSLPLLLATGLLNQQLELQQRPSLELIAATPPEPLANQLALGFSPQLLGLFHLFMQQFFG
jgi:hypothetical protein